MWVYVLCFILVFIQIHIYKIGKYNEDYLSVMQSLNMKGLLALLILFHHLAQIFDLTILGYPLLKQSGFLFVSIFFFYSGYGLIYSLKHKKDYIKDFFIKRIITLYLPFVIVNILYVIAMFFMKNSFSIFTLLKNIFGISLVNGIYWYIWMILLCYTLFYLLFSSLKEKKALYLFTILIAFLIFSLATSKVEGHWFLSLPGFLTGMWISFYEEKIMIFLKKYYLILFPIITLLIGLCMMYVLQIKIPYISTSFWFFVYLTFPILINLWMLLTLLKCKIGNIFLTKMGKISYEMYLVHPICINIASYINIKNQYFYILFVLLFTFITSSLIHFICKKYSPHILNKLKS